MEKILHCSDFHLGIDLETEEKKLYTLGDLLHNENIKYFIFTGDIIDAKVCVKKTEKMMEELYPSYYKKVERDKFVERVKRNGIEHIKKYNELLEQNYKEAMSKAEEIIRKFINKLDGIKTENIIFCCGNHDRLRLIGEKEFQCVDESIDENDFSDAFKIYDTFCKDMGFSFNHKTSVHKAENLNVIIVNANWRTPIHDETNNMCISCKRVWSCFDELLLRKDCERKNTFFVTHKPYDDICETVKMSYNNKKWTLQQWIDNNTSAFLYGDKHSSKIECVNESRRFMCGAPLAGKEIQYNLLDYNEKDGEIAARYIVWDGKEWNIKQTDECVKEIYKISHRYLENQNLGYLFGNEYTKELNWNTVLKGMDVVIDSGRFSVLSNLFETCSKVYGGKGKRINISSNLFAWVTEIIASSEGNQPVSIKGEPGTGKSLFLVTEYLYMLRQVFYGRCKFLPFYFNMESLLRGGAFGENINIQKIIEEQYDIFNIYIEECLKVATKYQMPVCIFIDGLESKNMTMYTDDSIDKRIYDLLKHKLKHDEKYIMCFNSHFMLDAGKCYDFSRKAENVIFMNDIDLINYNSGKEEKYEKLINTYLELQGIEGQRVEEFISKLMKLRINTVNLKFLHSIETLLFDISEDAKSWDVMLAYKDLLEQKSSVFLEAKDLKIIGKCAYWLYSEGEYYQEIIAKLGEIDASGFNYRDFTYLKENSSIANYLIAKYFVYEMIVYSSSTTRIPRDSVLYGFVTRNISIMIRLILADKDAKIVFEFVRKHREELTGYLYSTVIYILGHMKIQENITNKIEGLAQDYKKLSGTFSRNCNLRSYEFALAVRTENRKKGLQLTEKLMKDEEFRKFNRIYQLYYYEDIVNRTNENAGERNIKQFYGKGFDFRKTFLTLVAKLRFNFQKKLPYALMEVDLFTICDMVYVYLQLPVSDEVSREEMLFYGKKYNHKDNSLAENILAVTGELLKEYIDNQKNYSKKCDEEIIILAYFKAMIRQFEQIKNEIHKNADRTVESSYVYPGKILKQVQKLNTLKRIGWYINKSGNITKREIVDYNSDEGKSEELKETYAQYIMETVYIAELFLPETIEELDINMHYSKARVISLLLMSNLGKIETQDYVPQATQSALRVFRESERNGLEDFLSLGATDGYVNHQNLLKILDKKIGTQMDINYVICEEIQMIQMEYKYYSLYSKLGFTEERRRDLEAEFQEPETEICREIRKKLITENPEFYMLMKQKE